jgi:hypothetical protein
MEEEGQDTPINITKFSGRSIPISLSLSLDSKIKDLKCLKDAWTVIGLCANQLCYVGFEFWVCCKWQY